MFLDHLRVLNMRGMGYVDIATTIFMLFLMYSPTWGT